jgi:hypothetical protein
MIDPVAEISVAAAIKLNLATQIFAFSVGERHRPRPVALEQLGQTQG